MATESRERAGITIEQVIETLTPTPLEPTLVPVAVGPCFQKVEAVGDDGSPLSAAQTGTYSNLQRLIKSYSFPNPRNNLSYLSFLPDETRAFLQIGGEVREFKDDERYLVGSYGAAATSVRAIGSGNTSAQIQIVGGTPAPSFLTVADSAVLTGDVDISSGANVTGLVLQFRVDGYWEEIVVTFSGGDPVSQSDIVDQINAAWAAKGLTGTVASISGNFVALTSPASGTESHIKVNDSASTAKALLGFGTGNQEDYGTAYKPQAGDEFYADGNLLGTIVSVDAAGTVTLDTEYIVYTGATPGELDATRWWIVAKNLTTPKSSDRPTPEMYKTAVATTASLTGTVDLSAGANVNGLKLSFKVDGTSYTVTFSGSDPISLATIVTQINTAIGAVVASDASNYLKLTSTTNGNTSKIEILAGTANTLLGFVATTVREGESAGDFRLAFEFLRNGQTSAPLSPGSGVVYLQYRALRKDVTVLGADPTLVRASEESVLETLVGPLTPENPLGLAMKKMLDAAEGMNVAGFGVDSVASNDEGDASAYDRALEFLKARDVYCIVPLTYQESVHEAFATHVDYMSLPDNKGFRCTYICPEKPDRKATTTAASGSDANSVSAGVVRTEADLTAALLGAGITDPSSMNVSDGVYMMFSGDSNRYNLASVSGMQATGNTTFAVGENTDGFYATSSIPTTIIAKSWSLFVRGTAIVSSGGIPNYNEIAGAYQDLATLYFSRRVRQIVPEEVTLLDGNDVSQRVPGYYLAAASAAQLCYLDPDQGKTNYPITGIDQLHGANDFFGVDQLKIIGVNNYMFVQEPVGADGVITRWHQATTDPTNDTTREESITTCLDWGSIILQRGLKAFIGRTNITKNFDDLLSESTEGLFQFIKDNGVWEEATLLEVGRSTGTKTGIYMKIRVQVPYPVNNIDITLFV